jgi:hypothetical protein
MDNIGEAMQFLKNNGVGYILSVPWASPMDDRLPPAYTRCIITRYLGDPDYFPPLFVDGGNGTAVYHVGALNVTEINQMFAEKGVVEGLAAPLIAPLKYQNVTLIISKASNPQDPQVAACYMPFPVDYRKGNITVTIVSINCTTHLDLQLWKGIIPADQLPLPYPDETDNRFIVANSPVTDDFNNPMSNLSWQGKDNEGIDTPGYFIIRVLDRNEAHNQPIEVTLDIRFYSFYDLGLS